MALLLCRRQADTAYYHENLGINIWTLEELSYLIYNYPLLFGEDVSSERLFGWIETSLSYEKLANTLRKMRSLAESDINIMSAILSSCNYYDETEISLFKSTLLKYTKYPLWEISYLKGKSQFKRGAYKKAYKMIHEAVDLLERDMRKQATDTSLKELNEKRAAMYCDLASIRMQLFDEKGALELIKQAKVSSHYKRAAKLKYLIEKTSDYAPPYYKEEADSGRDDAEQALSLEEKDKLIEKIKKAKEKVLSSDEYKKLEDMLKSEEGDVSVSLRQLVSRMKKEYRSM